MTSLKWIAHELDEYQKVENGGRGISCVQTIVTYLNFEDKESALAVINNEWDKIRNYPLIVKFLQNHQLASEWWI